MPNGQAQSSDFPQLAKERSRKIVRFQYYAQEPKSWAQELKYWNLGPFRPKT